jgi:Skp family chaperone for outer membrane proteins
MKQPRLNQCLLFSIAFCGLVLRFPPLLRAEEMPVPSATPAATATAGMSPTATPAPEPPSVRWVGVRDSKGEKRGLTKAFAGRGDEIWVDVINFQGWLKSLQNKKLIPENLEKKDLILYLNHVAFKGVHPFYWTEWPASDSKGNEQPVTTFGFSLVRNKDSKLGWSHLLNKPGFNRKVVASVGFENVEEIPSQQTPDRTTKTTKKLAKLNNKLDELKKKHDSISPSDKHALEENERQQKELLVKKERLFDQQFYLTIIPKLRTAIGLIVILVAMIAFLVMARHTHIIRDPASPRRPDGNRPYSLARGQMAFWFFLVITAYFFLWIVTGDMDTLNASVLGLIGISAGTALGSAFVDAAKPAPHSPSGNQPIVDVTRPHKEVLAELTKLRADTDQELEALQKARTQISPSDKQALDDNEQQQNEVRKRLSNYQWQSAYFGWPTWKGVLYDLLAENNRISFHRFQIFVWTLILGIIFVVNVYNELAMPEFSATLLGLLGISAGTYVGFKLPESKAQ